MALQTAAIAEEHLAAVAPKAAEALELPTADDYGERP
jgi:hypothetical protein